MYTIIILSCAVCVAIGYPKTISYGKYKPSTHLVYGTPESAGLLSKPLELAIANITSYTHAADYGDYTYNVTHPVEPGSANIVGRCSTIVSLFADGKRDLYADVNGTLLPPNKQEDATVDTIYDMASLTKLFTTVAALQQIDAGTLDLHATVASYMPKFAVHGKGNITILMLMTHTSGFAPDPVPPLYYPVYVSALYTISETCADSSPFNLGIRPMNRKSTLLSHKRLRIHQALHTYTLILTS